MQGWVLPPTLALLILQNNGHICYLKGVRENWEAWLLESFLRLDSLFYPGFPQVRLILGGKHSIPRGKHGQRHRDVGQLWLLDTTEWLEFRVHSERRHVTGNTGIASDARDTYMSFQKMGLYPMANEGPPRKVSRGGNSVSLKNDPGCFVNKDGWEVGVREIS